MPKYYNKEELYKKLQSFCAYRERCSFEVHQKLQELGANSDNTMHLISKLKEEGFINDKRFAETYVRSKLFNNKWGKLKAKNNLKQLNIPEKYINNAMDSINEEGYKNILQTVIDKKINEISDTDKEIKNNKIARHCIQKGFESSLVWQLLNDS